MRTAAWVRSLPDEELLALMRAGQVQQWRDGDVVLEQNDNWQTCIMILEGSLRQVVRTPEGVEFLVTELICGEVAGLVSLQRENLFPHSMLAIGPTLTLRLSAAQVEDLVMRHPACGLALIRMLALRLGFALKFLSLTTLAPLKAQLRGRIELGVLQQSLRGAPEPNVLRMSQREVAQTLGASRQRVNSALRELEDEGTVKVGYGSITLLAPLP
jgi:CRP-like cAMP-binding protein